MRNTCRRPRPKRMARSSPLLISVRTNVGLIPTSCANSDVVSGAPVECGRSFSSIRRRVVGSLVAILVYWVRRTRPSRLYLGPPELLAARSVLVGDSPDAAEICAGGRDHRQRASMPWQKDLTKVSASEVLSLASRLLAHRLEPFSPVSRGPNRVLPIGGRSLRLALRPVRTALD